MIAIAAAMSTIGVGSATDVHWMGTVITHLAPASGLMLAEVERRLPSDKLVSCASFDVLGVIHSGEFTIDVGDGNRPAGRRFREAGRYRRAKLDLISLETQSDMPVDSATRSRIRTALCVGAAVGRDQGGLWRGRSRPTAAPTAIRWLSVRANQEA